MSLNEGSPPPPGLLAGIEDVTLIPNIGLAEYEAREQTAQVNVGHSSRSPCRGATGWRRIRLRRARRARPGLRNRTRRHPHRRARLNRTRRARPNPPPLRRLRPHANQFREGPARARKRTARDRRARTDLRTDTQVLSATQALSTGRHLARRHHPRKPPGRQLGLGRRAVRQTAPAENVVHERRARPDADRHGRLDERSRRRAGGGHG